MVRRIFLAAVVMLGGCGLGNKAVVVNTAPGAVSTLSDADLRDVLADLAQAHNDKIELAFWVSTPLRPVDEPFKPFFQRMGTENKELLGELTAWAKQHHVNLAYSYGKDFYGQAQKLMEERQEKQIRADDRAAFEREILLQMYTDYEWRISELETLLPMVRDAGLKDYAQKALSMYEAGDGEIAGLLRHYQFSP
jgi:Domain of unknown function (DUF4142)